MNFPFFIFLFFPGFAAQRISVEHDFKMSVCEMIFASQNEDLQLKFYLFQDDLKQALYNNSDAPKIEEQKARDYLFEHFALAADGNPAPLKFESLSLKNDQVLIQFTSPGTRIANLQNLQVTTTILISEFRKQVNMVYLIAPEKDRITLMLHASKTKGVFLLN